MKGEKSMALIIFLLKTIVVIALLIIIGTFTIGAYSFMTSFDINDGFKDVDLDKIYERENGKK